VKIEELEEEVEELKEAELPKEKAVAQPTPTITTKALPVVPAKPVLPAPSTPPKQKPAEPRPAVTQKTPAAKAPVKEGLPKKEQPKKEQPKKKEDKLSSIFGTDDPLKVAEAILKKRKR
jgi:hypothetical protein